ncbi:hypothetical protein B0H63DRAFT_515936 [Podospora didyma]|uniref:Uncharacterized protein n=1 Tax=Podospora didyma TaxID=330526 RepID=A0AAE0P3D3_9PEZI|nr:hypothetical protein B0H63DRAFT_515936 [Podospora didyma]
MFPRSYISLLAPSTPLPLFHAQQQRLAGDSVVKWLGGGTGRGASGARDRGTGRGRGHNNSNNNNNNNNIIGAPSSPIVLSDDDDDDVDLPDLNFCTRLPSPGPGNLPSSSAAVVVAPAGGSITIDLTSEPSSPPSCPSPAQAQIQAAQIPVPLVGQSPRHDNGGIQASQPQAQSPIVVQTPPPPSPPFSQSPIAQEQYLVGQSPGHHDGGNQARQSPIVVQTPSPPPPPLAQSPVAQGKYLVGQSPVLDAVNHGGSIQDSQANQAILVGTPPPPSPPGQAPDLVGENPVQDDVHPSLGGSNQASAPERQSPVLDQAPPALPPPPTPTQAQDLVGQSPILDDEHHHSGGGNRTSLPESFAVPDSQESNGEPVEKLATMNIDGSEQPGNEEDPGAISGAMTANDDDLLDSDDDEMDPAVDTSSPSYWPSPIPSEGSEDADDQLPGDQIMQSVEVDDAPNPSGNPRMQSVGAEGISSPSVAESDDSADFITTCSDQPAVEEETSPIAGGQGLTGTEVSEFMEVDDAPNPGITEFEHPEDVMDDSDKSAAEEKIQQQLLDETNGEDVTNEEHSPRSESSPEDRDGDADSEEGGPDHDDESEHDEEPEHDESDDDNASHDDHASDNDFDSDAGDGDDVLESIEVDDAPSPAVAEPEGPGDVEMAGANQPTVEEQTGRASDQEELGGDVVLEAIEVDDATNPAVTEPEDLADVKMAESDQPIVEEQIGSTAVDQEEPAGNYGEASNQKPSESMERGTSEEDLDYRNQIIASSLGRNQAAWKGSIARQQYEANQRRRLTPATRDFHGIMKRKLNPIPSFDESKLIEEKQQRRAWTEDFGLLSKPLTEEEEQYLRDRKEYLDQQEARNINTASGESAVTKGPRTKFVPGGTRLGLRRAMSLGNRHTKLAGPSRPRGAEPHPLQSVENVDDGDEGDEGHGPFGRYDLPEAESSPIDDEDEEEDDYVEEAKSATKRTASGCKDKGKGKGKDPTTAPGSSGGNIVSYDDSFLSSGNPTPATAPSSSGGSLLPPPDHLGMPTNRGAGRPSNASQQAQAERERQALADAERQAEERQAERERRALERAEQARAIRFAQRVPPRPGSRGHRLLGDDEERIVTKKKPGPPQNAGPRGYRLLGDDEERIVTKKPKPASPPPSGGIMRPSPERSFCDQYGEDLGDEDEEYRQSQESPRRRGPGKKTRSEPPRHGDEEQDPTDGGEGGYRRSAF